MHVSMCFAMHAQNISLPYFSRHSCNWTGLMCNPSRDFKGREAWTDVVLLVYQMGLYDEKSIIPIQASLPLLVHYKALHSLFFFFIGKKKYNFFLNFQTAHFFLRFLSSTSSCLLSFFICFSLPPYLPHLSLSLFLFSMPPPPPALSLLLKTCKCGIS